LSEKIRPGDEDSEFLVGFGNGDIVDGTGRFDNDRGIGVVQKVGDARVAQAAEGESGAQTHCGGGMRGGIAERAAVANPFEADHRGVAEERVAVLILFEHRE
jgi:hypothetical protein